MALLSPQDIAFLENLPLHNTTKPLPPYGKKLIREISKNKITNGVNIFTSWGNGKIFPNALTFPPDAQPTDFDWSFLQSQEISLINTKGNCEYEKLKELAVLLVKSGVKHVGLIDVEHPLQWFVPKEVAA
jgi:hypothetical protein